MSNAETPMIPRPPGRLAQLGEIRVLREPLRLALRTPKLRRRTRNPTTVIAIPGFGANDLSNLPLRAYLQSIGHRPRGWGLGTQGKDLADSRDSFIGVVDRVVERIGEPVALVGWSLGGIVARETARERPELVSQVITYGSPFGGPRFTGVSGIYDPAELSVVDALIDEAEQRPMTRPITAIHSKRDGVVDWRSCLDRRSELAENIEVSSSHVGLGIDPDVWGIIADKLENPPARRVPEGQRS